MAFTSQFVKYFSYGSWQQGQTTAMVRRLHLQAASLTFHGDLWHKKGTTPVLAPIFVGLWQATKLAYPQLNSLVQHHVHGVHALCWTAALQTWMHTGFAETCEILQKKRINVYPVSSFAADNQWKL